MTATSGTTGAILGAVLHGPGDLRLEPVPREPLGPRSVRLRLGAAGICGSDQHYFRHARMGRFVLQAPFVLGHEMTGDVVEVGPEVSALAPGDRVVVDPALTCGRCEACRRGRANLCRHVRFMGSASHRPHLDGGFRDEFVVEEERCIGVPPTAPHAVLALSEPLSVALHAAARAGDLLGRAVLVTGAGTIGALVAACARAAGAARICVSDPSAERRDAAMRMGATETIDPAERDRIAEWDAAGGAFDVAFEASGNVSAFEDVVRSARFGGTVVLVGMIPAVECRVPFDIMTVREIDLISTFRQNGVFARAVSMLLRGAIDPRPIVSGTYPLPEVAAAFDASFDRDRSIKILLTGSDRPDG